MQAFGQLSNVTNNGTSGSAFLELSDFISIIAVGVAFTAFFFTFYYERKNFKRNGLNAVFEKINDREKRKARGNMLVAYSKYLDSLPAEKKQTVFTVEDFEKENYPKPDLTKVEWLLREFPSLKMDMEVVKNDLEQIAIMKKYGMIDEKAYFDAYWGTMLRCLPPLIGHIKNARDASGNPHFTVYYEEQCKRAIQYWKEKDKDKPADKKSTIKYFS